MFPSDTEADMAGPLNGVRRVVGSLPNAINLTDVGV